MTQMEANKPKRIILGDWSFIETKIEVKKS